MLKFKDCWVIIKPISPFQLLNLKLTDRIVGDSNGNFSFLSPKTFFNYQKCTDNYVEKWASNPAGLLIPEQLI